jgi:hypothetical protein
MRYFYNYAVLPKDEILLERIELAADRLNIKLKGLDLPALGISEYNQRYLGNYIRNLRGILQINTYLLAWSISGCQKPIEECTLVDYGGGPGVLSLLARELGLQNVIYNDIYEVSCRDFEKVARSIQCEPRATVLGDIDTVIGYAKQAGLMIDAITSYDVIEHIYDTEGFFRKIKGLPHQSLRMVMASSANMRNPIINKMRRDEQVEVENRDRPAEWGHKQRDSLRSYLNLRKEIIRAFDSSLSAEVADRLAVSTRGLYKDDIEKCVAEFKEIGKIRYTPDHPTNTCDPLTGNWSERLMDTNWIVRVLGEENFDISIKCGFYAYMPRWPIQWIKRALNLLIRLTGARILAFAPYYVVFAQHTSNSLSTTN